MEFLKANWFLLLMLLIASALVFVWLYFFNKEKLNAKWWELLIVTIIHTGYGVLTVKFFALLEAGFVFEKAGNMSLFGAIFFMPIMYIAYALVKKLPVGLVFDTFVVPLAATLALARINCLYAGCCQGIELGSSGFKWPAREFDIATHVSFLVFSVPWIIKGKSKGMGYPLYLITYGAFRFINEWFRESESPNPFHLSHIWSIISILIGIASIIIINIRQKKGALGNENN